MCLVFKSELAQAHAEKAEDEPPQRARGKPRPTLHGAPLKQTRQIVKKKKPSHPDFAPSQPTSPEKKSL